MKYKVTSIEVDNIEAKKYISTHEFDSFFELNSWIYKQFKTEYCEHFGIGEDEFNVEDYPRIDPMSLRCDYTIGDSDYLYIIEEYRDTLSAVESFMYYMWNAFSDREASNINWHCSRDHIIEKWHHYCDKYGPNGAIAPFFGELDGTNRQALVDRAMKLYDGKHNLQ